MTEMSPPHLILKRKVRVAPDLREEPFFYPRLFEEQGFAPEDFGRLPAHQPPLATPRWPWRELLGMLAWTGFLLIGARRLLAGRADIRP
jgi:hypothetical protein